MTWLARRRQGHNNPLTQCGNAENNELRSVDQRVRFAHWLPVRAEHTGYSVAVYSCSVNHSR